MKEELKPKRSNHKCSPGAFSERGVTDVKVSEIAAKAHVSQVSIYNYFGNKNGLAREVLATYLDKAIKEYEDILGGLDIPFSEKLKMIMAKSMMW